MEIGQKGILSKGFSVNELYNVLLFVKKEKTAETYRVKGSDGQLYFLKLFNVTKLQRVDFDKENNLIEIELVKKLSHVNIEKYKDNGELIFEGKKYPYLILDFIAGENLKERISRKGVATFYDVKEIIKDVLSGLNYLHDLRDPVIHNEIIPQNVMLDLSGEIPRSVIIGFGHARHFHQSTKMFNKDGLDPYYIASECFYNLFSPQSDLFSVGAVMYHVLFGTPPWYKEISKFTAERVKIEEVLLEERKKPIRFPNVNSELVDFDPSILKVLKKALHPDPEERFQSAHEFIHAINGDLDDVQKKQEPQKAEDKPVNTIKKTGKGFMAIAGMEELKEQLRYDVINVIENPEEYKKHNLGLPNGILLYGPPGCGKTFFAERFAEEAGYNFIKVVSSDIASIYVHGSQEKIGRLFKEAKENAPTILYFDELDAMVPNREKSTNQSQSGEVNEFLSQLDNIGHSGVFVIGSTNKPDTIDKAVLRAGRLEKWYYIPPPDHVARKALFDLYLKERPLDFGIDYDRLATITEKYVSSDIKLLVDEASRKTIRDKAKRITMQTLEEVIAKQKPTVSLSELMKYEGIRKKIEEGIEDDQKNRTRIGFNLSGK